jgi:hypothetical protein
MIAFPDVKLAFSWLRGSRGKAEKTNSIHRAVFIESARKDFQEVLWWHGRPFSVKNPA